MVCREPKRDTQLNLVCCLLQQVALNQGDEILFVLEVFCMACSGHFIGPLWRHLELRPYSKTSASDAVTRNSKHTHAEPLFTGDGLRNTELPGKMVKCMKFCLLDTGSPHF